MINKIYEEIKKFIIENYKFLILLVCVFFICWIELPYAIYAPGDLVKLDDRITVEGGYKSEGSFNMASVSLVKGTIPLLLASYILPNWDIVSKKDITYDDESISELLEFERLQFKNAIFYATSVAYEKTGNEVIINNVDSIIVSTTDKAQTNVKKYDILKKINGIEINNFSDIRNIIDSLNEGDKVTLTVLRNNKEIECYAVLYKENDRLLMGLTFTESYDYDTNPKVTVKTKKSEAGASGGLMLTLTIYNALVEDDITNGKKIAGTGTIEKDGSVGPIDGVKYKLLGAVKRKADIFICPKENYEEAIKYKEELKLNIPVYAVETFDDAIEVLKNNQ